MGWGGVFFDKITKISFHIFFTIYAISNIFSHISWLNIHTGVERPPIVFNIMYLHGVDWVVPVMKDFAN